LRQLHAVPLRLSNECAQALQGGVERLRERSECFVVKIDRQLDGEVAVRGLVKSSRKVAKSRVQVVPLILGLSTKPAVAPQ
jgi:hypothetical protein